MSAQTSQGTSYMSAAFLDVPTLWEAAYRQKRAKDAGDNGKGDEEDVAAASRLFSIIVVGQARKCEACKEEDS